MILSLLKTYSRLFIFAGGLLLGIQVPNFVDQYERRIDAHYLEVSANISGFQSTADLLFAGDIQALIAYYQESNDAVFESDAQSIRSIVDRYDRISAERAALSGSALAAALHVILYADDEFIEETFNQYGYTVPLNLSAVEWGLAIALLLTLTIDLGLFGCVKCAGLIGRKGRKNRLKSL
ncbi:MAG: hypothetical protein DHS20C12_25600 [Pseudohongiella sp.]|nr:MAG: hypothetical protein DHS20C12_25600 [Pseudohongiella sp.]